MGDHASDSSVGGDIVIAAADAPEPPECERRVRRRLAIEGPTTVFVVMTVVGGWGADYFSAEKMARVGMGVAQRDLVFEGPLPDIRGQSVVGAVTGQWSLVKYAQTVARGDVTSALRQLFGRFPDARGGMCYSVAPAPRGESILRLREPSLVDLADDIVDITQQIRNLMGDANGRALTFYDWMLAVMGAYDEQRVVSVALGPSLAFAVIRGVWPVFHFMPISTRAPLNMC